MCTISVSLWLCKVIWPKLAPGAALKQLDCAVPSAVIMPGICAVRCKKSFHLWLFLKYFEGGLKWLKVSVLLQSGIKWAQTQFWPPVFTCFLEAMARMWESEGGIAVLQVSALILCSRWPGGNLIGFLSRCTWPGGTRTAWSCLRLLASCCCVYHQQEKFTVLLSLCDLLKKKKWMKFSGIEWWITVLSV